ncbi:hypothetical protein G7051_15680 [Dysgonomonas sp. HDW5B]|uniref:hypothetical protein n=1 Tax=Dysgonomonas sp. HDW5B TaxID=2714927 RepID=UPI00140E2CB2|nr:hypothetical protein [Dysgonomonas sp. HDW5B]QIK55711.1 hypothetical protein G7051_15680 [Dysgonomonas sp. HDW5B]
MDTLIKGNLDLGALYTFFTEDTSPNEFAKLLDEFLFDYMNLLVKVQLSDEKDKTIHARTDLFVFYIKTLRDILPYCEKG